MKYIEIDTDCNMQILETETALYDDIRKRLGGDLEDVKTRRLGQEYLMFVDEDGLSKELEVNPVGCYFYETEKSFNPIVGNIYIAKMVGNPISGYDAAALADQEAEDFIDRYGEMIYWYREQRAIGRA